MLFYSALEFLINFRHLYLKRFAFLSFKLGFNLLLSLTLLLCCLLFLSLNLGFFKTGGILRLGSHMLHYWNIWTCTFFGDYTRTSLCYLGLCSWSRVLSRMEVGHVPLEYRSLLCLPIMTGTHLESICINESSFIGPVGLTTIHTAIFLSILLDHDCTTSGSNIRIAMTYSSIGQFRKNLVVDSLHLMRIHNRIFQGVWHGLILSCARSFNSIFNQWLNMSILILSNRRSFVLWVIQWLQIKRIWVFHWNDIHPTLFVRAWLSSIYSFSHWTLTTWLSICSLNATHLTDYRSGVLWKLTVMSLSLISEATNPLLVHSCHFGCVSYNLWSTNLLILCHLICSNLLMRIRRNPRVTSCITNIIIGAMWRPSNIWSSETTVLSLSSAHLIEILFGIVDPRKIRLVSLSLKVKIWLK